MDREELHEKLIRLAKYPSWRTIAKYPSWRTINEILAEHDRLTAENERLSKEVASLQLTNFQDGQLYVEAKVKAEALDRIVEPTQEARKKERLGVRVNWLDVRTDTVDRVSDYLESQKPPELTIEERLSGIWWQNLSHDDFIKRIISEFDLRR